MLMKKQNNVSLQRGLPVEVVADASKVVSVTGETVQLYYYNSGVLTTDAGQAAGTVVVGKLAKSGVLNALGDVLGNHLDTSLAFTCTALTAEVAFPWEIAENADDAAGASKANAITTGFTNGQYCVDYRTGTIFAKKNTTASTMTSTSYKIASSLADSSAVAGSDVVATGNVAHDAADSGNPLKIGGKAVSTAPTDVTANDRVDAYFDLKGRLIVAAKSGTATLSNVASSATSVTLLAANTARLGATISNDSTAALYVKFGATASTTSFVIKLLQDDYYEVPYGYTGIIDGIWASATGSARITELT